MCSLKFKKKDENKGLRSDWGQGWVVTCLTLKFEEMIEQAGNGEFLINWSKKDDKELVCRIEKMRVVT